MFDLKSFRIDKLKMTQTEFAELIGIRQDKVSRLEQSVNQIPLEMLIKIATASGTTIDELVNYKRPIPATIKINDTWRNADFIRRTIVDYVEGQLKKFDDEVITNYDKYINELRVNINQVIKKPKIAIVGHSDVGKSRLINSILGSEKMVTSWTPTTSITVYIKHINDRPNYIEEDAWVFKSSLNGEQSWDENRLNDEFYCRSWKIAGGSADILKGYGTRQGDMYDRNEAGTAVIFVDSDILKNCDIIDLPGFGTGDRVEDDTMTFKAKEYADVLIYMSHAGQFLQGEDIEYLKESIVSLNVIENKKRNNLRPLSNLFILASQSHTVDCGNQQSLERILSSGCERLEKTLPEGYWNNKSDISGFSYDSDILRSRFYTYTTDIEHLRKPFEEELKSLVEVLPQLICEKSKQYISEYIKSTGLNLDNEIQQYTSIINEREKYNLLLKRIEESEPKRIDETKHKRQEILKVMNKMSDDSVARFINTYEGLINQDKIVELIKEKDFNKKKEDIQSLVSYINSTLQTEMQEILKFESERLKIEIDKYIIDFEGSIKINKYSNTFPDIKFSFDTNRAFAGGLAGLATFGGLAIWASTLGNLGAYILVAKGVSILSAIGISVGGTAAAASAVAAIGGPIVLGIAISILTAVSVFALLSGGWDKKIAKKIVKEYDNKNCLLKYKDNIKSFWKDTEIAFNSAADSLENEWINYIDNLKEVVSSYDIDEIKKRIEMAEKFKNFILGIPL